MGKWLDRKGFEAKFIPINAKGKNVWVIHRVKKLPLEIVEIAIRLSALDFINYVRLTDEMISASSEVKGSRIKEPVTSMNHPTAIGVAILYNLDFKIVDFVEINSPIKGNGSKMVSAVLDGLDKDWQAAVLMDWSGGFWDKMMGVHHNREWLT
jgi:hypothetical protein